MTFYDRRFGADWEHLDLDEATERAHAIGVAEQIGEPNHEELERLYRHMDAAYERTIIELAYEEGRQEAAALDRQTPRETWTVLVVESPVEIGELPTGGLDGLPGALEQLDALEEVDIDSRGALDRPEFLDR